MNELPVTGLEREGHYSSAQIRRWAYKHNEETGN